LTRLISSTAPFLLTVFLIVKALTSLGQTNDITTNKTAIVDIEIAAFKYLFNNNASGINHQASYYYISITDSANKTLATVILSLKSNKPGVKDIEEYKSLTPDKQKEIKFLSFQIGTIKFADNKVYVHCGYYEGSLSSSGNILTLIKKRRRWKVINDEMLWIS
jgi:hypothetical protein